MNLQQKQGVMLKNFEIWLWEIFGGRWKLDLEMVNCDLTSSNSVMIMVFIWSLNHTENVN